MFRSVIVCATIISAVGLASAQAQAPRLTEREPGKVIVDPELEGPLPPATIVPEDRSRREGEPTRKDLRFETDLPDPYAGEAREAVEARMAERVEAWHERISQAGTQRAEDLNELRHAWRALEQGYQRARQSRRPEHWEKSREDFLLLEQALAAEWKEVSNRAAANDKTR